MDIKTLLQGSVIVLPIAALAYFISTLHASFDALVVSIILGMFAGNLSGLRESFDRNISACIKLFLPPGIALYGSQLIFTGLDTWLVFSVFLVFVFMFATTIASAGIFGLNKKTAILLATGLSVCGASAIAVVSPLIGARREDTSISVISLIMLGLTGMIFYPLISDVFMLTGREFSFLSGATLPMIGQVKVAAGAIGASTLAEALDIKLLRVSFLFFVAPASVLLSGSGEGRFRAPWFITAFIVLAVVFNSARFLAPFAPYFKSASTFLLSAGLAAIGFTVDFDSIVEEGVRPLGAAGLSWMITVLTIYLVRNIF